MWVHIICTIYLLGLVEPISCHVRVISIGFGKLADVHVAYENQKSLLIIYFIYILFGATIITKIEQPVEEERCRKGLYQVQIQIRDLQQEEAFLMWSVNFRRWNKVFSKRSCKTKDRRFRKIIFFRIRIESQARVYASFLLYVGDQRSSGTDDIGPMPGTRPLPERLLGIRSHRSRLVKSWCWRLKPLTTFQFCHQHLCSALNTLK